MSSSYDSAVIDTAMIEDHRLLSLPRGVRLLNLEAMVWCKAHLTDGFVPSGALRRMTDEPDEEHACQLLVDAGLWERVDKGWQIVGFTDSQMSAERVREKREAARDRYDKWQRNTKRVANATANDPARPAPPARKGGGQVGGEPVGLALRGEPPAKQECDECGREYLGVGYGTPEKPLCSVRCQLEVETRSLQAVEGGAP